MCSGCRLSRTAGQSCGDGEGEGRGEEETEGGREETGGEEEEGEGGSSPTAAQRETTQRGRGQGEGHGGSEREGKEIRPTQANSEYTRQWNLRGRFVHYRKVVLYLEVKQSVQ